MMAWNSAAAALQFFALKAALPASQSALAKPRIGPPLWAAVGLVGAVLWAGRHLLQWWISERLGRSTLPRAFWLLSLVGSILLVAYAISRRDPVMIIGYAFGCIPYLRNLILLKREASAT